MPVLWRYLLKSYFQSLLLCVATFVSILIVVRFQEIALFASSGARALLVFLFSLYQIPYILPLAIPISCLIAAFLLLRKMSDALELTALRACGIGIRPISASLLLSSVLLCALNFSLISEITPLTRLKAKNLIYRVISENPLVLMQKDALFDIKMAYFDLKKLKVRKKAEEVLCILRPPSSERLALFTAKEITVENETLKGIDLSAISSADAGHEGYDHLLIENQKQMTTSKEGILSYLLKSEWFAKDDLLCFKDLLQRYQADTNAFPSPSLLELLRRGALGMCPFTFTIMGIAFGSSIGRKNKKTSILVVCSLAFLILGGLVAAKSLSKFPMNAFFLYAAPQPIALLLSLGALRKVERGIE